MLHFKYEATSFKGDILNTNNFKSFNYKVTFKIFLKNTGVEWANGILGNATIAVPLKYWHNFGRSLEIPLINCKVELKIKWKKLVVCALLEAVALLSY